jgi:pimeloyl-ACP methyl ester carboxylesterase
LIGSAIEDFCVSISDGTLADLRRRLEHTRLPTDIGNDDWSFGFNGRYLHDLVTYWLHSYDWRTHEAAINAYQHRRVVIDGVPVHFMYARGSGPHPKPLILTHGWPWTFWDYEKLIGPLTDPASHGGDPADAFDIVVPSLPGFAFSSPLRRSGVDWVVTADLWATLMHDVLGYKRYAAFGGDWGRIITLQLGHKHPEQLIGAMSVGTGVGVMAPWNIERPWDLFGPVPQSLPPATRAALLSHQRRYASHIPVHVLEPQTLANALHDSPAGLAAWLVQRRRSWADCDGDVESRFTKDDLLTTVMLYWCTETFASSVRFYSEAARRPWRPSHDRHPQVECPTGFLVFSRDTPLSIPSLQLGEVYNVQFLREHDHGGHFAPAEEPQLCVEAIRDFLRGRD